MNSHSSLKVEGEQIYTNAQTSHALQLTILKFLKLVAGDTNLVSDFMQVWSVREFQLGDELATYTPTKQAENQSHFLYLVCQGKVRLLGLDINTQREVLTNLLLAEQTFGVDDLFYYRPLPYRAIAASTGYLAFIQWHDLQSWLKKLPNLQNYLQQSTDERQALIFLKTSTELRSNTSHKLRQIFPYLVSIKVSADSSLVEATGLLQGYFWLADGTISSSTAKTIPPKVGESWRNIDVAIPDWIAKTDLLIYHLPQAHWDLIDAIAPQVSLNQHKRETQKKEYGETEKLPLSNIDYHQPENSQSQKSQTEVDFPRPQNQRWLTSRLWRRYPFIPQQDSSDCGAACLAMISLHWGKRFSLGSLRRLALTDRTGASLSALADAAEALGYDALPIRASLSKLELQANPWIAHWQGIHYIVVWQIKGDRVLLCDPAIGRRSLLRAEFEANWTGYGLLLFPTKSLEAKKSDKVSFSGFWHIVWHHRSLFGQIILASVLLPIFGLAAPIITQVVLDRVLFQQSLITLNIFAIGFLFFGIWRITVQAVRQYLLDYLSNRMDLTLLGTFMSHILRLPLEFFTSRQAGDIITRIHENRKIQLFFTKQAVSTTLDAVMVVIYLGLMAYYNLPLTFLVLGLVVPILVLTVAASPFLKNISRELLQKSAVQNSAMVEMVTGITTVKTAAVERPMRWRWEERLASMVQTRFRGQKLANNLQLATSLINHLGTTGVLWYGATLVINQQMSVGQFVAFNMLIGSVIKPVLALVGMGDDFQEAGIFLERLHDVLVTQPEENPQKPLSVLPPIRGDICFENVSFFYNTDNKHRVLQNVSFRIKPGQTVGIVGASGSGKSTLVNLLAGLYRPQNGRILIDGHDIANVSPQSLRSQLGIVSQDIFLFAGSILENITLFNSEISLEQAIAAAKLAEAHAFIQTLPLGYNTRIGQGGIALSGGQKQRIAIARVFIRNSSILIFDEATSCLDADLERRFQQNLNRLSNTPNKAVTTFIITHRLSSLACADCILVLDKGNLVEQGTHQELIKIGGFYYNLVQQQSHL